MKLARPLLKRTPYPDDRAMADAFEDLNKTEVRCEKCSARTEVGISACGHSRCPMRVDGKILL